MDKYEIQKTKDALVVVNTGSNFTIDLLVKLIESAGGYARHIFSPSIVIATLPIEKIDYIGSRDEVQYITTEIIEDASHLYFVEEYAEIIELWNNLTLPDQKFTGQKETEEGISWDSPGYLPPDPPTEIRKMIDNWEKNNLSIDSAIN